MFHLVQWVSGREMNIVKKSDVIKVFKDYALISWSEKTYNAKILAVNGK